MQLLAVWGDEVMTTEYYAITDKWYHADWEDASEPDWWAEYPTPPEEDSEPCIIPPRVVEV